MSNVTASFEGYADWLGDLKSRIQSARMRAALAVNSELVRLYWEIGRDILARQQQQGWGTKVIERLAADLRNEFQDMKGFSRANMLYMRAFAEAWPDEAIVQQLVGQLPWGQNLVIMTKVKSREEREWYARKTFEHGWSRNILVMQIESRLYQRQGKAITNFERTLPPPQSDLVTQALKDPYLFDFLGLGYETHERELERGLTAHITRFLLELGAGFSYVGRQVHLEVAGEDFYLDLLFYHLKLRCYVVIELKANDFKPEYAGKMNFYLSAVDDLLRHPGDEPTIGLILCKNKKQLIVEYALRDSNKPIGVSEYLLTEILPSELEGSLPTVEQLEAELGADDEDREGA